MLDLLPAAKRTVALITTITGQDGGQPPSWHARRLGNQWRGGIPERLRAMARAWRDPAAWGHHRDRWDPTARRDRRDRRAQ